MSKLTAYELNLRAYQASESGNFRDCLHWAEQAENLAHAASDPRHLLNALELQVAAWASLGEHQRGLEAASRLITHARQAGDQVHLLTGTRLFAICASRFDLRNRWIEIRPVLLEGLHLAERLNNAFEQVYHLLLLGSMAGHMDELEEGYTWLQAALRVLDRTPALETESSYFRVRIYQEMANLLSQTAQHHEAVQYAKLAQQVAQTQDNPLFAAIAQLALARAEQEAGELGEALNLVAPIAAQARRLNWRDHEKEAEFLRAEILVALGEWESAEQAARRGLELAREMRELEEEVECLICLGQALHGLDRLPEAADALLRAQELSQARNYEDHWARATELLHRLPAA